MPSDLSVAWICSQLGAREHYAIPRALHTAGKLREFHTDLWSSGPWQAFRSLGSPGRDLAGRFHPALRQARIHAYPLQGLPRTILTRCAGVNRLPHSVLSQSNWFDHTVARHLARFAEPTVFFSYTGTFLETARRVRAAGGLAILGQVDPAETEERIVAQERQRWPGWESPAAAVPPAWSEKRRAEWAEADLVLVNSEWCRRALCEQDVPEDKLRVVPLAYEPPDPSPTRSPSTGKLRVLWLGQVILRKGIAYLLEAARLLQDAPVEIRVAGPVSISREAVASAPPNVRFTGHLSRSLVASAYASADLFVLPTLSDGFAITQIEAMAHGLPVIATPCCGEVVVPGRNGVLIPPADANALAQAIASLAQDRSTLASLSEGALQTSREFGLDRLTRTLVNVVPS